MTPNTAQMFREGKAELHKLLGNHYIIYNSEHILLPNTIVGLLSVKYYKDFQRRLLSTLDDVTFIQNDFLIAKAQEPENKMKVFGKENNYAQDVLIGTTIYLSSLDDPVQQIHQVT